MTLESLHLTAADVVTISPDVDLASESSSTRNLVVSAPRPFNVLMVPDPPGEVEKLRSDLDQVLKFTHNRQRDAEGLSSSHDGVGIMQPAPSPSSGATESTFRKSAYYQQPTSFIPLLLLYLFMVPRACKLLYGGRALAHEHIPVMTTFASFFIAFHICRAIFGVGLLTSTTCLLAAYGGHCLSMKPLRWLRIGPRALRKEPIGWVFEIFCVCGVMANVIYRVILAFVTLLLGGTHVPLWLATMTPIWYHLHMFVVSGGILLGLIKIVPTYFAQDFVFAFSSLYVIFSGISCLNDVLMYNSIIGLGLVALDPASFFVSEPDSCWSTSLHMSALFVASFYATISENREKVLAATRSS